MPYLLRWILAEIVLRRLLRQTEFRTQVASRYGQTVALHARRVGVHRRVVGFVLAELLR